MGVETKDKPKGIKPTIMNGQPNGDTGSGGTRSSRRSRRKNRNPSYAAWVLDKGLKIVVWYSIITLAFRCPKTQPELTETSPRICKPAAQARDFVYPYVHPYYEQYLDPYVQKAQPYVDRLNEQIYKPGLATYQQHGAPRVTEAQKYGQQHWEKTIKPQLETAKQQAGKQYDAALAPHVKKVQDVVQPYYDQVKTSASDIWELEIQPVYRNTAPYAQKIYDQSQDFAVKTALPQAQYASDTVWTFWTRQVWPRVCVLYGQNVEPQLNRITERLGRYKDGKRLEAEIKSMESESKAAEASSKVESVASSLSSTATEATASPSSAASVAASSSPKPSVDPIEQFREDLKKWEAISAKAVDEGAEDLKERIQEITAHKISSQAEGVGNALVIQLEDTAQGAINSVKARIETVVVDLPEEATDADLDEANEQLALAIRAAGQNVKARAQAIREWHQGYKNEIDILVDKALQSTLETIDSIRELRLTEIGRRFADKDLPHKEWSRYNDLKKGSQSWRDTIENVAKEHVSISSAKEVGEDVESRGMSLTEETAKELGRLKEVAKWKVDWRDASEDFNTKYSPPVIGRARQQIVDAADGVKQAVMGEEEKGTVESATSAASGKVQDSASQISEAVVGSEQPSAESATSEAKVSAESAASAASAAVVGSESSLSDTATDAASTISETVVGSETPAAESISSSLSSKVADEPLSKTLGSKAASILAAGKSKKDAASEGASDIADNASSTASSASSDVSSSASSVADSGSSVVSEAAPDASDASTASAKASKKVFAGANAQVLVEAREPILDDVVDDEGTYSERIQSIANAAKDQANALTEAVAEAFKLSPTSTQGTVESMTSLASEQYESAMAAASSALFGGQLGSVEKGSSAAREQYLSAVTAASYAIYGTPSAANAASSASSAADSLASQISDATDSVAGGAKSQYSAAMSQASVHYEAAKSRVSVQISGTPEPVHKQMFDSVEAAYSDSVAAVSEKWQQALGAVPVATTTQGAVESISSIAASRLAEALGAASSQYQNAKIAVGAEPTPAHQAYLASAQRAYYEGLGMAHDRYSSFLDAASSAVGATPTTGFAGWMAAAESTYSAAVAAASSNVNAMYGSASSAVSGTTQSPAQSYLDQISSQYDAAVAAAAAQLAAASSQASGAVYGQSTGAAESISSAASSAIYGSETPTYEAMASKASENWEALVSQASERVYGAPPPFTESVASQAGAYMAQATEAAAGQYEAVQALFSELISGKEPDFTESVMGRLQSVYSTGAPGMMSSASSYASEAYASASSAVVSVFTPPSSMDTFMDQVNARLNSAVDAASAQVYGSSKGTIEQATDAAAKAYSHTSSIISEAIYGRETSYAEAAQNSMSSIAEAASKSISEAIYGAAPTGTVEAAQNSAASAYSSVSSVAAEQAGAASSAVSSAVYGEEKSYVENMQEQISAAMASAQSRIAGFGSAVSEGAKGTVSMASEAVEDAASSVSSAAAEVTGRVKDEL